VTGADSGAERRDELAGRLAAVRDRIGAACAAAGRDPGEVTLIAVTKTYPVSDIALLSALSLTEIGENRDQEAAPKAAECAGLGLELHWHFVGQLQSNKARSVAGYADVVHSVDRSRLVSALGRRAAADGRLITGLVQVSLDGDTARGGAPIGEVPRLAATLASQEGLRLGGVMAVAPQELEPAAAFSRLREVAETVRAQHPSAVMLSAGMSADLEAAIAAGATHVRVGTALLGGRRAFVR
jgi:pyridoxal phosphate enzyme (YggS family)